MVAPKVNVLCGTKDHFIQKKKKKRKEISWIQHIIMLKILAIIRVRKYSITESIEHIICYTFKVLVSFCFNLIVYDST